LTRFRRSDVVVLREIWHARIWKARPWIVVHDQPEQLALYIPKGTPTKIPPGSGIPRDTWYLEDGTWTTEALRLTTPGEPHSILLWWEDGEFTGWYLNLERPLQRTPIGFDYLDRELDIHVRPDGTWELLDEDEFEEAQRLGVIDAEEAAAVVAEAERVVERIEAWASPFGDRWESWRPDPAWSVPALPDGWDVVDYGQTELASLRSHSRPSPQSGETYRSGSVS
jgi:uncharacterized protein